MRLQIEWSMIVPLGLCFAGDILLKKQRYFVYCIIAQKLVCFEKFNLSCIIKCGLHFAMNHESNILPAFQQCKPTHQRALSAALGSSTFSGCPPRCSETVRHACDLISSWLACRKFFSTTQRMSVGWCCCALLEENAISQWHTSRKHAGENYITTKTICGQGLDNAMGFHATTEQEIS